VGEFLVQTLGCKLNQLESEAITGAFAEAGFTTESGNAPLLIIINTCTVTSKADQKARRVIRKALNDYPDAFIIVTGCYAQLNREDILKLGGKNRLFVFNKNDILSLPRHLKRGSEIGNSLDNFAAEGGTRNNKNLFQFNPKQFLKHSRAYLKIQDGCDKNCAYCKIRLVRGKSASLEKEEVLSRLRILEKTHAEASLTGVNISQYLCSRNFNREPDEPDKTRLADLLDYLLSGTEKIKIRLSSLAPESVDEKLAKIFSSPRIQPHFHLSVQSLSDKILLRMGRAYKSETAEKAAALLRRNKDDPFIACDIITGFPGETREEFEKTFEYCKKLDFAWIHVFPYSKRQGTPAFSFTDNVTESEITKRVKLLTTLAKEGRTGYARRWLGQEADVLVENHDQKNRIKSNLITGKNYSRGTSENYLKVLVKHNGTAPKAGTILRCKFIDIADNDDFFVIAEAY